MFFRCFIKNDSHRAIMKNEKFQWNQHINFMGKFFFSVWNALRSTQCAHGIIITQFNHTNSGVCIPFFIYKYIDVSLVHVHTKSISKLYSYIVHYGYNHRHLIILLCEICSRIFYSFFALSLSSFLHFFPCLVW